jgi:hypothetical protein
LRKRTNSEEKERINKSNASKRRMAKENKTVVAEGVVVGLVDMPSLTEF